MDVSINIPIILEIIILVYSIYIYYSKTKYIKYLEEENDSLKRAYKKALEINENYTKIVSKYLDDSLDLLGKRISNIVEKR